MIRIDVRSDAERVWLDLVPDAATLAGKRWPGMVMIPDFDEGAACCDTRQQQGGASMPQRVPSIATACHAAKLGTETCNTHTAFEGNPDANDQCNQLGDRRFQGLSWKQN